MLKKIGLALFAAASLCTASQAMVNNTMQQHMTVEYELQPNEPQLFTNPMFWAIEANCEIITEDESDDLLVEAIAKKGKINDIPLNAGESMSLTVHHGENLKLRADSGAKVQITNYGNQTVKAVCVA
jgi:hypothetical protein